MTMTIEQVIVYLAGKWGVGEQEVKRLIDLTSEIKGARFAHLAGYRSDASDYSEEANHTVILGFSYEKMKEQEAKALRELNLSAVELQVFNYNRIDLAGRSLADFQTEVRSLLPKALGQMLEPKKSKKSNDVWLNRCLVFNTETLRLSIVGEEVRKTVVEAGDLHKPASKPLTVAKRTIEKVADVRTANYRRFCIDNFDGRISLQGETVTIGG